MAKGKEKPQVTAWGWGSGTTMNDSSRIIPQENNVSLSGLLDLLDALDEEIAEIGGLALLWSHELHNEISMTLGIADAS